MLARLYLRMKFAIVTVKELSPTVYKNSSYYWKIVKSKKDEKDTGKITKNMSS